MTALRPPSAQVYGELSLSALAAVLCEHADAVTARGTRGGAFVDLGAHAAVMCHAISLRLGKHT